MVWIDEEPALRMTIEAEGPHQAMEVLRAEHGEQATISVWNEEDAARSRRANGTAESALEDGLEPGMGDHL